MKTFTKQYEATDITGGTLVVQHNLDRKWTHVAVWVSQPDGTWLEQATAWPLAIRQVDSNTIRIDGNALGLNPVTPFARVRVSG